MSVVQVARSDVGRPRRGNRSLRRQALRGAFRAGERPEVVVEGMILFDDDDHMLDWQGMGPDQWLGGAARGVGRADPVAARRGGLDEKASEGETPEHPWTPGKREAPTIVRVSRDHGRTERETMPLEIPTCHWQRAGTRFIKIS